jgi:hypothetical protein
MPRRERRAVRRSITAAAKNYSRSSRGKNANDSRIQTGEEWQAAAWDFFDLIGEFRQAPTIKGALLSRAKLYVAEKIDGEWVPTTNDVAIAALDELYGGSDGHEEMLRLYGEHLDVAGEGWLIGPPASKAETATPDDWQVAAPNEVKKNGTDWKVNGKLLEGRNRTVIRIWRAHPKNKKKADAPARAVLPILSELLQLRKRVAAQIDSRLTGNGLVILPAETEFPSRPVVRNAGDPETRVDAVVEGAQGLADLIFETARIAIQNPESAEAMLPLFGTVPGEYLEKIQQLNFWSELDKAAPKMREEQLLAIARGMDIPIDILLGTQGSNHWNAWLSDENNVKIHGEPPLKIITTGLTTQYLWVALDGEVEDPRKFKIMADTSQMRLRPNRSKEAMELNQAMILSDDAVLRENGFTEADRMTEEGMRIAILRSMARGSTTPELVHAAAKLLGVNDLPEPEDERPAVEGRPQPSLVEHPVRELPKKQDPEAAKLDMLTMVCEQIVDRALQRAGNRIKSQLGMKQAPVPANRLYTVHPVPSMDLDEVLQDAWDAVNLRDYGVPVEDLTRALDIYARSLLRSGREPSFGSLRSTLKLLIDRTAA